MGVGRDGVCDWEDHHEGSDGEKDTSDLQGVSAQEVRKTTKGREGGLR